MRNRKAGFKMAVTTAALLALVLCNATSAQGNGAVNVILKNDSSSPVDIALIDQYGGNFTVTVEAGMAQNQTLKAGSEIKVGETVVHVATPADEGKEIVIAGQ